MTRIGIACRIIEEPVEAEEVTRRPTPPSALSVIFFPPAIGRSLLNFSSEDHLSRFARFLFLISFVHSVIRNLHHDPLASGRPAIALRRSQGSDSECLLRSIADICQSVNSAVENRKGCASQSVEESYTAESWVIIEGVGLYETLLLCHSAGSPRACYAAQAW